MGAVLDVASGPQYGSNDAAVGSVSWSHTCSGSNRVLYVSCGGYDASGSYNWSAKYNNVSMDLVGSVTAPGAGDRIFTWRMIAPPTGANTVIVTIVGGQGAVVCGASSWTGVDQTTPNGTVTTANNTSTNPTVTQPSSTAGNQVFAAAVAQYNQGPIVPQRTVLFTGRERNPSGHNAGSQYAAGGGSQTMNWTCAYDYWAAHCFEILSAASASNAGGTTAMMGV